MEEDRASLRVEVRDTGTGVPESARSHLFDAMASHRMDSNIREAGTGLGLHLVKLHADVAGARIAVVEREGGGSVFQVAFRAES